MDVIFENQKGGSFSIEIGYFDTVYEIKEKIQKYRNIPISHQTLVFNGKVLLDDGNVESCVILHNSRIRLVIARRNEKSPETPRNKAEEQLSPILKKTQLLFRLPTSKSQQLSLEVDLNDSVELLKEKLHEIEGFPASRLALFVNGNNELQDQRYLREYELTDGSEIEVSVKPCTTVTGTGLTNNVPVTGLKKLKVLVLPKCGTKKVIVEVNPADKVQMLRNELEKLQQRVGFQLPPEGYFFIYKQNVMEESETFQWHNVRSGDIIEIFNGCVTGGS